MDKIVNLKQFKVAKAHLTNLKIIIHVLSLSLKALKPYQAYTSVDKILKVIENEKLILESHYNKYKKFVKKDSNE